LLYADKCKTRAPESDWLELLGAIDAGDQQALYELYERTHRIVFTLIARIVNDRATAEELTLDVFHDVWRRASTYDPAGGTVVGWIMNQARSRAIDRVRFEGRKKRVPQHADTPNDEVAASPQEEVDRAQRGQILREACATLTPAEREAIESTFFAECTYAEAAARLEQPLGTVKTRIRSALTKLRNALGGGEP
jgi:RNA polymerase sigma-70 factor (ECF subfamily)